MDLGKKQKVHHGENRNIRILYIDLWQGPAQAHYTGPLLHALCSEPGIQIGFLHNRNQDLFFYPEHMERFPIHAPTGLRLDQWDRLILQPWEFVKCLRAMEKFNPDIIHLVFSYPWFTFYLRYLAKRHLVTCTLHDITPHHGEENLRNRMAIQAMIRFCNPIFVHGRQCLDTANHLYPEYAGRFVEIPLGNCDFLNSRNATETLPEKATFLFFGRLLPYKGLSLAMKAFEEIIHEYPDARMIIAGEGSLEREKSLIFPLRNNLEIINRVITEMELAELMGRSLAVLAPYTHASGSAVVATSYAFARPVIASNIGGMKDMVIHDITGWLVEPGSVKGMVNAMKRAIENPAHMLEMGVHAKEHSRREWSWEKVARIHIQAYEDLLRKMETSEST